MQYLIITGDPIDGFGLAGPLGFHDAIDYAQENFDRDTWWRAELLPPPGVKEPKGQHVLVAGSLAEGFKFYGPSPSAKAAAVSLPGCDWSFVVKMDRP